MLFNNIMQDIIKECLFVLDNKKINYGSSFIYYGHIGTIIRLSNLLMRQYDNLRNLLFDLINCCLLIIIELDNKRPIN